MSGSGFLDGNVEKNRCGQTITLQREADVLASKAAANSTTAKGNLLNFGLTHDVRGDALVDLSLSNHNNTLTGVIRVRNVQVSAKPSISPTATPRRKAQQGKLGQAAKWASAS